MVLIFEGNSDYVAHAWRKTGLFGANKSELWLRSIELNSLNISNKRDHAPYVRTYFWVTILYKYHGAGENMKALILDNQSVLIEVYVYLYYSLVIITPVFEWLSIPYIKP